MSMYDRSNGESPSHRLSEINVTKEGHYNDLQGSKYRLPLPVVTKSPFMVPTESSPNRADTPGSDEPLA